MDVTRELALRTDAEIQQVLNRMIKGAGELDPSLAALMASPDEMKKFVSEQSGTSSSSFELGQDPHAARAVLVLVAEDASLSPALEASLKHDRETRDPITAALVLAGIVLVLSTSFEVDYSSSNGKRNFSFKIKKTATPTSIIKKFFGILGGTSK
jgi:hypothetical protein